MKKTLLYLLISSFVFYLTSSILHLTSFLYSYPPGWSDDILLTPEDDKNRMQPDLDVDEYNNVWAVWDSGTWVSGTAEILYSKRDSLGDSLIPETDVSNNASYSTGPRIAVDASNNIQFVWLDESSQGIGIWHAKLANDGSIIVPSHLAVSGNNDLFPFEMVLNKYKEINVIWDEISGCNQMNYTKLDSLGNPIIPKIKVSLDTFYAYWPGIGIDSMANSHLGYRTDDTVSAYRLTYTKLDRNGNVLIDNKFFGFGYLPTMVADRSQNIHMVYGDHTGPGISIEYLKLDQDANILVGPITLSIHENNSRPHMAMDSLQYLHVVWTFDNFADTQGLMYAKLDTFGDFVISPTPIVFPPHSVYPYEPRIAVDYSNRLHLVWKDQRLGSEDIFYKRGENEPGIEETAQLEPVPLAGISAFPNPFSKEIKIRFSFSRENEKTKIAIFDVAGRKVNEFILEKSCEVITWQGKNSKGNYLPSGLYFLQYKIENFTQLKKIMIIR